MIAAVRSWIAARALPLLGGALGAAVLGFAVQTWRVSELKADVARLRGEVKAASEAAKLSEALRAQEQAQDKASFSDLSSRCEQRVITAIDSAKAIEEVTYANAPAPAGVAARPIVGAGQLRRIIGQAPAGGAASVPAGSNSTAKP